MLGFRGEVLGSASSVALVSITTGIAEDSVACRLNLNFAIGRVELNKCVCASRDDGQGREVI